MNGFVADYKISVDKAKRLENDRHDYDYRIIMNCFPPEAVPVLSGLARDFAVCDEWFCSVPTQTFPNRSFFHAATSQGYVVNADFSKWFANDHKTIFNLLSEHDLDWRVYWDRQDMIGAFTRALHPPIYDQIGKSTRLNSSHSSVSRMPSSA